MTGKSDVNKLTISSPRCSIQILNVMTDKIPRGQCCNYPENKPLYCFSVYHSCANIVIKGSIPVWEYIRNYKYRGPCGPYTQQSGVSGFL